MSGTRISSTFDGRWVKTIVLISPIRAAIRAADSDETAASRFAPKKIAPRIAGSTPNRRWNQYAMRLCGTKPPPNASSANSADSRATIPRDRPRPKPSADPVGCLRDLRCLDRRADAGEDRGHGETDRGVADEDRPIGVDVGEAGGEQRLRRRSRRQGPDGGRDVAGEVVPGEDRASAARRASSGSGPPVRSARNGPTSLPVGLITPIVAARMSSGTELVARTRPRRRPSGATRRSATRRRPIRSACVVSQREMSVSPTSVSVRIAPIVSASRPSAQGTGPGRRRGSHSRTSAGSGVANRRRPSEVRPRRLAISPESRAGPGAGEGCWVIGVESTWENARRR